MCKKLDGEENSSYFKISIVEVKVNRLSWTLLAKHRGLVKNAQAVLLDYNLQPQVVTMQPVLLAHLVAQAHLQTHPVVIVVEAISLSEVK